MAMSMSTARVLRMLYDLKEEIERRYLSGRFRLHTHGSFLAGEKQRIR